MLSSSTSLNPELTQADSDYVKASGKSFPFCGSQFPHLQNEELHERAPEIFWSLISLSKKFLRMKPSYKYNYKLYLYSCSNNYKYYKTYPFILHMKNEETGWSLKSFSSKILMMYMCRSLSFLTCTMLLYLHTLHYSLNKHLKIPQTWATVLDAEIEQRMRQTWPLPSVIQRVLLRIKGNTAVFEYWEFYMVHTIRCENDLLVKKSYNSCN